MCPCALKGAALLGPGSESEACAGLQTSLGSPCNAHASGPLVRHRAPPPPSPSALVTSFPRPAVWQVAGQTSLPADAALGL